MAAQEPLVLWFEQIGIDDVSSVGGKNASLGEMYCNLSARGIAVPNGFATTAAAYRLFMSETGLDQKIREILDDLDTANISNLQSHGREVRQAILATEIPEGLRNEILQSYRKLSEDIEGGLDVAVRSSATAEDLPDASFAGQQESYLNVHGESSLLDTCRRCFASLFTDRAISYRTEKGFDHFNIALSIGIQRMVRSDESASGVMFSIDTETGFRQAILINAAYGLGENVVQGSVNPDEFYVFKPTLKEGFKPILKKTLGSKEFKLIYDTGGEKMTRNVPVDPIDRKRFAIDDEDILKLARWACLIEEHYSEVRGHFCPMDIEWAKDGLTDELFIVQARPETIHGGRELKVLKTFHLKEHGRVLSTGHSVGERIGHGVARVVESAENLDQVEEGDVLVTDRTDPDWEPIMKKASAIVTNRGGRTCHAAIISRELGVPAIVGAENATTAIPSGSMVTVSCAEGDTGQVYDSQLDYEVQEVDLSELKHPKTKVMMIVGNPNEAFHLSMLPSEGVGLARMEFIINSFIRIHPMALLEYDKLEDPILKSEIDRLTASYSDKPAFFVDTLAQGVGMIAGAFYPRDVIVRMSDFKTNEYANLIGGEKYEPQEENPMIGFRGASRYYHPRYRDAFGLECQAMRKVREEMGLKNMKLMIPFCRTVEEGRKVLEVMAEHGLKRGEDGLEIYIMCEIPSNVIQAEAFAEIFDGFSIGSNDLTQLTLGVDRDSEVVAHIFDERDPAVMDSLATAIQRVKASGRKIGICGQAPSDYPEIAAFLVKQGIDSISLNPDAVMKTVSRIVEVEAELDSQGSASQTRSDVTV
ncbi:Phosphoenolpyruvate synthase [Gimesia chilikensis]|uniref:Phosphoenolpyruvate synthase n=1 Tax=Gimesia chilikensis TaxID=2605989 RepID=A0A517WG23_9PLAN|nr:phosphoenolpyruvate synthase [Gimesia chilikensis]QDU04204.1 Phosphoenolpyruvate synthase [Gimesia chilikensis]